jgi:hypothetical protein
VKLSKGVKILVGILTAIYVLLPILFIGGWFTFVFGLAGLSSRHHEPPEFFLFLFPVLLLFFVCFINLLHFGMICFYLVHTIRNRAGSETLRALLAVGFVFLPVIGMPAYYFIYILPDNPPDWALQPVSQ